MAVSGTHRQRSAATSPRATENTPSAVTRHLAQRPIVRDVLKGNTFPFPSISGTERERIITAGQAVLDARTALKGQSLAQMHNPVAMDAILLKARVQLEKIIDRLFGFAKVPSAQARSQRLFERYVPMTQQGQLSA